MIDSHAHLDSCEGGVESILDEARAGGVSHVVTIGCGRESSVRSVALAEAHPEVFAVVGVHPNQAADYRPADDAWMRDLATHPRVVAIGECGLDYYRDRATPAEQMRAFDAQIQIAVDLGMPLVIHTRDATDDCMARLAEIPTEVSVLLHCFSIPERTAEVVERGYWASFAGPLTYPRNADLRAAAARLPLERILVETDAPYLSPQPVRGRPNQPAHVAYTLAGLAQARGLDVGEADAVTAANTRRLFGIPDGD